MTTKSNDLGYSGYITSRTIAGNRTPQHVQNLVIRDYARRQGLTFRLSATEFAIDNCYLALDGLLDSLDTIDGIILFSLFMLPPQTQRRQQIFEKMIKAGKCLHAATEEFQILTLSDAERAEDVRKINHAMASHPTDVNFLRHP